LKTLDILIKEISNDAVVKRFKELEKVIDNDELLNKDYKQLLNLQKIMVIKREKNSKDFDEAKKNYYRAKENVMKHIILNEYLDLLEEINYDLRLIQKIISQDINIDFK